MTDQTTTSPTDTLGELASECDAEATRLEEKAANGAFGSTPWRGPMTLADRDKFTAGMWREFAQICRLKARTETLAHD